MFLIFFFCWYRRKKFWAKLRKLSYFSIYTFYAKYGKKNQDFVWYYFFFLIYFFLVRFPHWIIFSRKKKYQQKKNHAMKISFFCSKVTDNESPKRNPKTAKMSFRIFRFRKNCQFKKCWSINAGVFNEFSVNCETWKNRL